MTSAALAVQAAVLLVAVLTALAGAEGAYYNVRINLADITNQDFCDEWGGKAEKLLAEAGEIKDRAIAATVAEFLGVSHGVAGKSFYGENK